MERLILDISLIIIALGAGYLTGFRAGFDYFRKELNKHLKD